MKSNKAYALVPAVLPGAERSEAQRSEAERSGEAGKTAADPGARRVSIALSYRTFPRIFASLGSTSPTKALNSLSKWTASNSKCSPKKRMNTASHAASSERLPRCGCASTPDIQGFSCSRPGIEASAALE